MKRAFTIGVLVPLLVCAFAISAIPASATAQDQRSRGLKIKVGATSQEASSNQPIDLWAVLIGVSRYKYGDQNLDGYQIGNLKNAADDAQAIYDFLRSPEGGNFRDESEGGHMVLLKDEQATRANVEKALANIRKAKPNDYFVIYIAAHGSLVPYRAPGSNTTVDIPYFVLHDTDLRDPLNTAIKMDSFRQAVGEIPARKGLVLSDTCHSGGVQLAGRDAGDSSRRANNRYIEEMNRVATGVGFISAADQLEQSFERDDLNKGVFTHCLLQALAGSADVDKDYKVTFNELVSYLREEVPRLTEGKQHPHYNTTAIEANYLPLSVVNYADEASAGGGDYGLLVMRTPDIDGVEVAIDGSTVATLDSRIQRSIKVKSGARNLSFTRGGMKRSLTATVEPGQSKIVEINLTFSESDEDSIAEPTREQLNVFLREEKEPSKQAKDSFLKGVESFNKQRFDEAVNLFNQAIQGNGNAYADAFVYRGRAEQSLGRKEAAVASFKAALALRPSDFETQTLLAEAKFNAGYNVEEVASDLRGIINRHPNFPYARVVYGDVLLLRRDFIGAERELRRALTNNPQYPPARLILADVLTYQDSKEKQKRAVQEAEKALQLFGEVSRKQTSASRGLRRLSISHVIFGGGRYVNEAAMAEAHHVLAKALTRVVERDETLSDRESYLARARTHLQEATKLAQKVSDKRRLVLVLDTSAQNYLLGGDVTNAITDAQAALKQSEAFPDLKDYAEAHYTLYSAYASDQKFAKAAEHLQKFMQVTGSQMSPDERRGYEDELKRLKRDKEANRQKN
jgi:tetratricopeptide (TPR) repeat protein